MVNSDKFADARIKYVDYSKTITLIIAIEWVLCSKYPELSWLQEHSLVGIMFGWFATKEAISLTENYDKLGNPIA